MNEPAELPRGMSIVDRTRDVELFGARCVCDWSGSSFRSREQAVEDAVEHARWNAWCYVHRNLTAPGADPVMGPGPEAGQHMDWGEDLDDHEEDDVDG